MATKKVSYDARAVVTGAGDGIGRAFALEVGRRGGQVIVADINLENADDTVKLLADLGAKAKAVKCDVSIFEDVEALAQEAKEFFGQDANLVINNAGVGVGSEPVGNFSIDDWRWVMGVNLWGVIHGCHVFAPILKAQKYGGIINVSSAASFGSAPMMASYNTTKAGVLGLSETLRSELASHGVKVTVLCPTLVKTNVIKSGRMRKDKQEEAQRAMNKIGASPNGVAIKTLDALDNNKIYMLPQFDAKVSWFLKRLSPSLWTRGMGLVAQKMV